MSRASLLVLTTVHRADDTRIREKLIPALVTEANVTYATRYPAPSDDTGFSWIGLAGNRPRRNLGAARLVLSGEYDAVAVHDPELVPLAIVASWLGRARLIVDVHEDVPAQIRTKEWIPRPARKPLAAVAAWLLRAAERWCDVTLAEPGYQHLFAKPHPVFPNFPRDLPHPRPGDGSVVYVGDVTAARGVLTAAEAVAELDRDSVPFRVVGPCPPDLAALILDAVPTAELTGPLPHGEAMAIVAGAGVGLSPLLDLPNYRHSLPTKILEYLGTGVPVIASDLPGSRDASSGLIGVSFVPPGDPHSLSVAIRSVLDDSEARARVAEQAAEVRARFSWPAAEVAAWYRSVLERD